MKIQRVEIRDIGGIKNLELSFNENFNVICGANGVGKTTILDVISNAFSTHASKLKKNALCTDSGAYKIVYSYEGSSNISVSSQINEFSPDRADYVGTYNYNSSLCLLPFYIGRHFDYIRLNALTTDNNRDRNSNSSMLLSGITAHDIKNWFVNRYAFHDKDDSLTSVELFNYEYAKQMFSILDETTVFKAVLAKTFDIILKTPRGDIYFEYLSSGYKSCIYIILGIIKEIEYRFTNSPIKFVDFDGCILIDEIEEHLHPSWQARLVGALKQIFPKAQFIITTYSPSILQCVQSNEIIALTLDESQNVYIKELNVGDYGLQGWTLEEILIDVMEMPGTTSELYRQTISAFDRAMNNEDIQEIKQNFKILDNMLHPNNVLRKLLQIQMVGLGVEEEK